MILKNFMAKQSMPLFISYIFLFTCLILITFFIIKCFQLLNKLKDKVIKKKFKRYRYTTYLISGYYISLALILLTPLILNLNNLILDYKNARGINPNVFMCVTLIGDFCILLFMILELDSLKKYFLGAKIKNELYSIADDRKMQEIIRDLISQKKFLEADYDIKETLINENLKYHTLNLFLKREYNCTGFKQFLNSLKVKEFKSKLLSKEAKNFDIIGIALESGFQSKAAFYRNFKREVGMTPTEYLEKIKKSI